jgi:hypothetical protein
MDRLGDRGGGSLLDLQALAYDKALVNSLVADACDAVTRAA